MNKQDHIDLLVIEGISDMIKVLATNAEETIALASPELKANLRTTIETIKSYTNDLAEFRTAHMKRMGQ
jgi:hypothetical protein